MKPSDDGNQVVLPASVLAEVQAAADSEQRPLADMLRELIERGLGERRWLAHAEAERQRAQSQGLPEDAQPITDVYRQAISAKIARGLQSLRDGKRADGETFFAAISAELDALEQQGHE